MIIEERAYARAGLLGNPSDGYFGKTISIAIKNFGAWVTLYESPELRIEADPEDINEFPSMSSLIERIELHGYYGGERLIKATIKKFNEYCIIQGKTLQNKNFTIRYRSTIPRQVGMAGSSAIITATMSALMKFYEVEIPKATLPTLILSVETDELGINAGLQDRVIQVYGGCVYMDFDEEKFKKVNHGVYESLTPQFAGNLFIAYKEELGKVSGAVLNDIFVRYHQGEALVRDTLSEIADLAFQGRKCILGNNLPELNKLINRNFDLRRQIMNISEENLAMIETARACGASAKFAGSGGSIVGLYESEASLIRLISEMKRIKVRVIKPILS
ncbi:MAG: GHMP kinase [Candidatus Marinimicrobia bacterium]|jgi:glucuronokinase|nr:GHMP kinase [Candidatus Neomarinimicrobiota bacterium]MBT4713741.1 GHMP kinase [Candidatus Neomarinimicrobiota bacterium]MBT6012257.1 GHMP kinase [Candidatus Neomarinimicrobiota bacterium]